MRGFGGLAIAIAAFAPQIWGLQAFKFSSMTLGQVVATGMVTGAIQTGSLRGALIGGLSAAMFHGIGKMGAGTPLKDFGKLAAHATAGGVISVLNGGKFGHGFASAGFVQAMSPVIGSMPNHPTEFLAAVVVGGTASKIAGGKFGNGAVTAAMQWGFNELSHDPGYGADLNLADPKDPIYDYSLEIKREPGTVTVLAHGVGPSLERSSGRLASAPDGRRYDGETVGRLLSETERFQEMIQSGVSKITVKIYACGAASPRSFRGVALETVGDSVLLYLQNRYPTVGFRVLATNQAIAPYGRPPRYQRTGTWRPVFDGKWINEPVKWIEQDGKP